MAARGKASGAPLNIWGTPPLIGSRVSLHTCPRLLVLTHSWLRTDTAQFSRSSSALLVLVKERVIDHKAPRLSGRRRIQKARSDVTGREPCCEGHVFCEGGEGRQRRPRPPRPRGVLFKHGCLVARRRRGRHRLLAFVVHTCAFSMQQFTSQAGNQNKSGLL